MVLYKKKDLTGAVASVSSKQLESVPVSSASEALTGKLPGVSITTTEGSPDADIKIRVRGGGSLTQDNSPLYIVDGFPVSSISDIAPSEIQSIDVLKDASSTAIYGARGANGVIIVTTKSGSEGKTRVDFNASYGIKKVTKFTKVLSPYDYALYQYELGSTDYGNFQDLEIWKSVKGTDFQNEIFGRTGNQTQYNVNVGGGSKQIKYNVSYAHNEETSIMKGSGYNKDNINIKINTQLSQWISMDFNGRLSNTIVDGLSGGANTNDSNAHNSIVAHSIRFRPIKGLSVISDDEESSNNEKDPLERINATYKKQNRFKQSYNIGLNWSPFKKITLRSEFGYTWNFSETDNAWASDATQNSSLGYSGQPQVKIDRSNSKNWRNANTITYQDETLFQGRDRINVLIGHEISSSQGNSISNASVAFPTTMTINEVLANMASGMALPTTNTIGEKNNMVSFFGRVNYSLANKYLINFTIRSDGSSVFARGNQWGHFPSAAIAWRISDEEFLSHVKSLSNLKIRLSYGTAGNNRISSGLLNTTYTVTSISKNPFFNETRVSMLDHSWYLPNEKLKWETTITRNIGIDYGFWNNRLSGSLDVYWNTTKDLLMRTEIPANTGYSEQFQNFGQTSNKGIEFSLNASLLEKKSSSINFNFNISYNRGKIDKLALENPWQSSNWGGKLSRYEDFRVEEGGRLGEVWGYKMTGFFTPYDSKTNPTGELILVGTEWKLKDGIKNNSNNITGGQYYPGGIKLECDAEGNPIKQRLGNTIAPISGGFGFDGKVGQFDFNLFFNYSIGNQIVNGSKMAICFNEGSRAGYNLHNDFSVGNRYVWIDPATGMNLAKPEWRTIQYYGNEEAIATRLNELNERTSIYNPVSATKLELLDYAVENASFLRVNNLTIGYTIPQKIANKLFIQRIRFYLTGYNLLCITPYSGADPEVDTSSKNNAMTPGIDYAAYPKSRSFIAGVNVSF